MNVKIEYVYIYRTVFVPPAGGASRSSHASAAARQRAAAMQMLSGMSAAELDPEKAKKLKKLEQMINFMLGKLQNIPAKGLAEKISNQIDRIMMMADAGAIDSALEAAESLMSTMQDALKVGNRVNRAMGQLNALMGGMPPEAKGAVAGVLRAAEKALDSCSTVDGMENIAGLLEKAVDVAKELKTFEPGTPGFASCLRDLAQITAVLDAHGDIEADATQGKGGADAPQQPEDGLALSVKNATETLKGLREQQRDSIKQQKIAGIENMLREMQDKAKQMQTPGMQKLVDKVVKQILHDTANGKVDAAHEGARELLAFVDRMGKMDRHVGIKQARAERIHSQLKGPAKDAVGAVLDKAKAAREQAGSPEELHAIDAALLEASQLAEKLQKTPKGPEAVKAMKQLKALEKQLGGLAKPEAEPMDRLMLSQQLAKQARPQAQTQPLQPIVRGKGGDVWMGTGNLRQAHDMPELPELSEQDYDRIGGLLEALLGKDEASARPQRVTAELPGQPAGQPQAPKK